MKTDYNEIMNNYTFIDSTNKEIPFKVLIIKSHLDHNFEKHFENQKNVTLENHNVSSTMEIDFEMYNLIWIYGIYLSPLKIKIKNKKSKIKK